MTDHAPILEVEARHRRQRLTTLLEEADTEAALANGRLQAIVQELTAGMQEMLLAEQELRMLRKELAASGASIDAERERYAELFEFAPDAYLVTDDHGKIVEANHRACELLGVAARALTGKLLVGFVDESARCDYRLTLQRLGVAPAEVEEQYLRLHPRDGAPFVAAVRAASRRDQRTHLTVLRWMIRDISERVAMEEEIRVLHAEVELLASLGHVARLTEEPRSVEAVLDRVVHLAAMALPGCEVSVSASGGAAVSSERARRLATAEEAHGTGPCRSAHEQRAPQHTSTAECRDRWPGFAAVAAEEDLVSVSCYPFDEPGGKAGTVTLYAFAEVTRHARQLMPMLVDNVAVALANGALYESARNLATHLQLALETRGVIERAKGVLIGRQGCSGDEAFDILRRASQRTNRKLRDVAADLVAQAKPDEAPAPAREQ